jgi:HSP20 family protein
VFLHFAATGAGVSAGGQWQPTASVEWRNTMSIVRLPFFADAPTVDIQETAQEYQIKAELPEMNREDVRVNVLDGVLTIEGERTQEKEEKGKKFHKMERSYGKFVRQFALPAEVDAGKVQAEYKDGVLSVHLPKTAVAKPTTVNVKVA